MRCQSAGRSSSFTPGHLATVNSAVIRHDNITADNPTPGIQLDEYGQPNGELQEPAAMSLASGQRMLREGYASELAKWNYAYEARNAGHTLGPTSERAVSTNRAWPTGCRHVTPRPIPLA